MIVLCFLAKGTPPPKYGTGNLLPKLQLLTSASYVITAVTSVMATSITVAQALATDYEAGSIRVTCTASIRETSFTCLY